MPVISPATSLPIKVAVEGVWYTEPFANVFHVAMEGVNLPTETELGAVASTVINRYDAEFSQLIGGAAQFTRAVASTLGANPLSAEFVPPTALTGGRSGDALPGNVSQVLTWVTGSGGRSGRGRTYLPGMTESALDGTNPNMFNATYVALCKTAAAAFITGINADPGTSFRDLTFIVYSPTTAVMRSVISANATPLLDTQRRRVRK
jgi:hypothetical protein